MWFLPFPTLKNHFRNNNNNNTKTTNPTQTSTAVDSTGSSRFASISTDAP